MTETIDRAIAELRDAMEIARDLRVPKDMASVMVAEVWGTDRVPVKSSNVTAVGYDPAARILEVEFSGGGLYRYRDVPPEAHKALLEAPSVGSHFAKAVKNAYATEKVK